MKITDVMQYVCGKGSLFEQILAMADRESGTCGLCGGRGVCGKCRVRFLSGAPLPSAADRKFFTPGELREGYRLACTAKPSADCRVAVCFAKDTETEILTVSRLKTADTFNNTENCIGLLQSGGTGPEAAAGQFCAADLGTTTVVMQLLDRTTGDILFTYAFQNPQRIYGMDVIGRLSAAADGKGEQLRGLIVDGLEMGLKEMERKGCPQEIIISGNTAMGHLLLGYPADTLGRAPFIPYHIQSSRFTLGGRPAVFLPGISAFVGADIVSGIYACGMAERQELSLFLDLGTNGEMAVGNQDGILCCAAAAGSAFEGTVSAQVMGTDFTALAFDMLQDGVMDETGLLQDPWFEEGYRAGEEGEILIRQEDIRNLQMAKAAICAGLSILLDRVDGWERLSRVYLAGGFGYYLDVEKAVGIGLIPAVLQNKCAAVGNASLAGAVRYGRQVREYMHDDEMLQHIIKISAPLNLAQQPEFEARYIEAMAFARM